MMDSDREARALAARVRKRDGASAADRARLRARLDPIWAEHRANRAAAAGDAAEPIAFATRRPPLVTAALLLSVSFWTAEAPESHVAASERVAAVAAAGESQPLDVPASAQDPSPPIAASRAGHKALLPESSATHSLRAELKRERSLGLRDRTSLPPSAASTRGPSSSEARTLPRPTADMPVSRNTPYPLGDESGSSTDARTADARPEADTASLGAAARVPGGAQDELPRVEDPTPVLRGRSFTPQPIDDELNWVGAAQEALNRGEPSAALRLVQEHAFRYPQGALANERRAVQALALCALQRKTAARSVLSDLERIASSSPLVERVRLKCKL